MEFEKTVNAMSFEKAADEKWYLSMRPASPKQTISVKFEDGKSYKFLGTGIVNIGDPVIIDYGGASSYKMGNVDGIEDGITIKRTHALKPMFCFTTNPGKTEIKKNVAGMKWLNRVEDAAPYFDLNEGADNTDKFHVVDYLVGSVLNAITVVAFPSLSNADTVNAAKAFLTQEKSVPSLIFEKQFTDPYYGVWFDILRRADSAEVAFTGFYPGWKDELLKCSFLKADALKACGVEAEWDAKETAYYLYFEDGSEELAAFFAGNEEFKTFTNELVLRSALSVIIRGGFVNLLEAALSVEMPIKGFYDKLKAFAKEIGSSRCYELLAATD